MTTATPTRTTDKQHHHCVPQADAAGVVSTRDNITRPSRKACGPLLLFQVHLYPFFFSSGLYSVERERGRVEEDIWSGDSMKMLHVGGSGCRKRAVYAVIIERERMGCKVLPN